MKRRILWCACVVVLGGLIALPALAAMIAWAQVNCTTSRTPNAITRIAPTNGYFGRTFLIYNAGVDTVWIGPDTNANFAPVYASTSYQLPFAGADHYDLFDWYMKSATATQQLRVSWMKLGR